MNNNQLKSLVGIVLVALLIAFSIISVDPIYSNLLSSISIIIAAFTTHMLISRNQNKTTHE